MLVVLFFSFWPSENPTSAATMNYSVLVTGFVVIFSVFYYLVWGKRVYKGPVVETNTWAESPFMPFSS